MMIVCGNAQLIEYHTVRMIYGKIIIKHTWRPVVH